jgi:uncharacterized membrane protein
MNQPDSRSIIMDFSNMFCKEEDRTLERIFGVVTGLGVGLGMMYLFDPSMGRRRRSLIMDQMSSATHTAGETISGAYEDVSNRTKGMVHEARSMATSLFSGDKSSQGGTAQSGQQNQGRTGDGAAELPEESWSPTTRMLVGTAGGALVAYGLTQRFPVACALGTVGLGLVARAVTNFEAEKYIGLGGSEPIEVHKSITINGPINRVFPFFARYDTFPRFMSHIREVKPLENGRSHWVADGPAGIPVQWDAVETKREPNHLIAWRSEPGSVITNAGTLRFTQMGDRTRVDVHLSYIPPGGAMGHWAAKLFGADPQKMMDEDLVRMKSLIEEGQTSTPGGGVVSRQEVTGGKPVPKV